MDVGTLQIMVFGTLAVAIAAFASYMADRQRRSESKEGAPNRPQEVQQPHTLL